MLKWSHFVDGVHTDILLSHLSSRTSCSVLVEKYDGYLVSNKIRYNQYQYFHCAYGEFPNRIIAHIPRKKTDLACGCCHIKMLCYQYREYHHTIRKASRPSFLYIIMGVPGKTMNFFQMAPWSPCLDDFDSASRGKEFNCNRKICTPKAQM